MWEPVNNFLAHLEYSTIDGSRHTVLYEGPWTTDAEDSDVTRLRLDCQQFPAFWVEGRVVGDDALTIDGGRFDDTWTPRPVSHTEFVCTPDDNGTSFVITHGDVKIFVPRPESLPRDVLVLRGE